MNLTIFLIRVNNLNFLYSIIDLLPFEFTNYIFMKNAIIAVLLVTPILGLLGTMIVNNKMSFFSDSLGHSALTGIGIGVLLGIPNTDVSMVLFAMFFAVFIILIKYSFKTSMDTTIGVFSSTAVALGIVMLSGGNFNKYSNIFIGDILSISQFEITMLFVLCAVVISVWCIMFNSLLVTSVSHTFATSRGISSKLTDIIFTVLIAFVVTVCIKWVGLLIINSLFVLPAAAARMVSDNVKKYTAISVTISTICGALGLITSYYLNTSAGATIALYCAFVYFAIFLLRVLKY